MNTKSAIDILRSHNKRITPNRLAILKLFIESSKPFTLSEIEKQLSGFMDRVTIYRTLQTFEKMAIVLKLVNHQGTSLYILNDEKYKKLRIHPHLHCRECDTIVSLPGLPDKYLTKLEQYDIKQMYFLMQGVCSECSNCQ